eukprot:XP_011453273.1 PREDICTED: uncharacterized protein LOC105346416 [Crassostrea gigas]
MLSFKVFILLIMVWSIQGVGGKPMCDPEDHKYYHTQADSCLQCEKCLQGEEAISLEDWNIEHSDPEKGPTECRLCRKCQPGTYSDKRSYKCEPCRNCTLYNQYQVSECTATSDTVCDGVRPTTHRPSIMKTSEPDPVKLQNEDDEDLNGSLTITGIICATVFIIVVIMIVSCSTKKFWCSGGNESEVDSVVTKSTASDLSKDVKIDVESDSQPLLQKGCESQIKKKPIELQTLGANPDEMDLLHGTSSNNKTKQGDLETDGPSEISPRRIQKEGELSNLNDEGLKTDSLPELPQDHPMSLTAQLINQMLFSLLAMVMYLILFFQYYKKSILLQEDQVLDFVSQVELDFSFYMLMSTVLYFTINMGFLFLTGIKFSCGFTREAEKVMDNGIILY